MSKAKRGIGAGYKSRLSTGLGEGVACERCKG